MDEWIIDLYAPYVLVRCAEFTNDRDQALLIGAYTLITVCLMTEQLDHIGQLGIAVDVVADLVGPDVVCGGADGAGCPDCCGTSLIADEWTQRLVEALNLLDRPMREALVLYYVMGIALEDMARVLNRSTAEAAARIAQAERVLARQLGSAEKRGHGGRADMPAILARFAAELDADWIRNVRDCAIDYLTRRRRRIGRQTGHWRLN